MRVLQYFVLLACDTHYFFPAYVSRPCIVIFDSLSIDSHAKVAATLREYLTCECKAKMRGETRSVYVCARTCVCVTPSTSVGCSPPRT